MAKADGFPSTVCRDLKLDLAVLVRYSALMKRNAVVVAKTIAEKFRVTGLRLDQVDRIAACTQHLVRKSASLGPDVDD
jgi:hypothetical protein